MALHQRNDRGDFVNPAGGGPRPKIKMHRGPDGRLEVVPPDETPTRTETRPDERPAHPPDPRPNVPPDHAGF